MAKPSPTKCRGLFKPLAPKGDPSARIVESSHQATAQVHGLVSLDEKQKNPCQRQGIDKCLDHAFPGRIPLARGVSQLARSLELSTRGGLCRFGGLFTLVECLEDVDTRCIHDSFCSSPGAAPRLCAASAKVLDKSPAQASHALPGTTHAAGRGA